MQTKATWIAKELQAAGFIAYFAGGSVRDMLLGLDAKDFDIATNARPEEVHRLFPGAKSVGAHFGVLLVHHGGFNFEIATFREDGNYEDGRRPEGVTFATPQEDAMRRDFTINGMFYDPIEDKLIDFVQGKEDLEAKVLRAIGVPAERFNEDHLRMLRALRFATRLGFTIEPATWSAIQQHAAKISTISTERCRDELVNILLSPNRVLGFDLLVESGLMKALVPEILDLKGCEQPPQFHPEGDVFVHTRMMLGLLAEDASLPLILSVLFHDIAKPATQEWDPASERYRFNGHEREGAKMTEHILRRLKFSNEIIEAATEGVANHMKFMHVQDMRVSKLKRFMARPNFEDELELHRVDCEGSHGMLDNLEFLQKKQQEFAQQPLIPPRLVTGHDLIAMGWSAGPSLGTILTEVQNAQLEGELQTREEAISWIREHYPQGSQPAK